MPIHVKKKRSFLPSLSSRRKVQDTLGHASNSATGMLFIHPSLATLLAYRQPVSHFPATQEYLSSERSAVDSIDEMVSALLNDTVATETSDELHPMRAQVYKYLPIQNTERRSLLTLAAHRRATLREATPLVFFPRQQDPFLLEIPT